MPYGYENHRLKNHISPNSIVNEVSLIRSFLKFVEDYYDKSVAPHEIRPIDVRNFLDNERRKPIKDSTVNRKLIYIRVWFNYMWEIEKIPVDFMEKFKYEGLDTTPRSRVITLNYAELLEKKNDVFLNPTVLLTAKLLFLFDMRGMRRRDTLQVTIKDIIDTGDEYTVHVETKDGSANFKVTDPGETSVLLQGIERAIFRNTKYLFAVKKKETDEYVQETLSSTTITNNAITKAIGYPVYSEILRYSYVHYLHIEKELKLEEIEELLGATRERAASILKEALVRVKILDYKMQRTS
jgi:integrase/recombinase XerD